MFVTVDDLLFRFAIHRRIPTVGERNSYRFRATAPAAAAIVDFKKLRCGLLNSQTNNTDGAPSQSARPCATSACSAKLKRGAAQYPSAPSVVGKDNLRLDVEGRGVAVAELPNTMRPARVPSWGRRLNLRPSPHVIVRGVAREFHPKRTGCRCDLAIFAGVTAYDRWP
jgi:hypothetical protein